MLILSYKGGINVAILIEDMEMPTDRSRWIVIYPNGKVEYSNKTDEWETLNKKAVPVLSHGRLIDADKFCTEHRSLKMLIKVGLRRFNWHIAAAAFVDDAPTIIPASEETEI